MFQIKGSPEFANRTNSIFDGLNELEEKHDKWRAEATPEILDCNNVTFKRPRLPLSLKRKQEDVVPDYIMNPHKWKKYSLEDTPNVTEESNTAAALQFLEDLRKRNAQVESDAMEIITYKKPVAQDEVGDCVEQQSKELSSASFNCSNVHKMPELVVGEKRKTRTKLFKTKAQVGMSIRLDHLEEHLHDEV